MEKVYVDGLGNIEVPPMRLIDFENEEELPLWDMEMDHIPEEIRREMEEEDSEGYF